MKFNLAGLVVLVLFFAALLASLTSGSSATHAAEAAVTILIAIGVSGFVFRNRAR
jgi:hypothetical protein